MDYLEVIVGAIAATIALWALNLQKKEIINNGRITSLIHASNMIQGKIDYYSKIINDKKSQNKHYDEWNGLAARINNEFRPLKEEIDQQLLELMDNHNEILRSEAIKKALAKKT